MRKHQCVCLLIGESLCVFRCSHNDTGLLEQTGMDTFSAFITPVAPESNAFTAWDLSLLKDKRQAQTLSPPLFSLSFCPLASHVHRRLKSEQKAALQSSQDSEPSWWSFILLFGAPLCPLLLVLCVGMSFICEPMKSLSCRSLLLHGSRQNVRVRVH